MKDENRALGTANGAAGTGSAGAASDGPVTVKKYANRRLYNTATSSYVTLENLAAMARAGTDVVVVDSPFGRIGLAVCYDLRFPELFRIMLDQGTDILAIPSSFGRARRVAARATP